MVKEGSFMAVNGDVIPYHFLIYLGEDRYMDGNDGSIYAIDPVQVETALKTASRVPGKNVLDFIEVLPERVFEVVLKNAEGKPASPLYLFNPKDL